MQEGHYYIISSKCELYTLKLKFKTSVLKFNKVTSDFVVPDLLDPNHHYYYLIFNGRMYFSLGYNNGPYITIGNEIGRKDLTFGLYKFITDQCLLCDEVNLFYYNTPGIKSNDPDLYTYNEIIEFEVLDYMLPEDEFYYLSNKIYKYILKNKID